MLPPLTTYSFTDRILACRPDWKESIIWYWANKPKYRTHEIEKKQPRKALVLDEGDFSLPKMRLISEPAPGLKFLQKQILEHILNPACASLLPCVHGCVQGRSTVTNAVPHVGCLWKVHMDLKDFFPSITTRRVYGYFARVFKYEPKLSWLLSHLMTWEAPGQDGRRLPQGAPTSPAIANLIAGAMDRDLLRLIGAMDGYYTRYVDDLTFSFRRPMSQENQQRFIKVVAAIAHRNGFVVNHEKTSIVTRKSRMVVTGVVVNSKPSIPKWFRSNLRAAFHHHSLELPSAEPITTIMGKLAYVQGVCPEQAAALMRGVALPA